MLPCGLCVEDFGEVVGAQWSCQQHQKQTGSDHGNLEASRSQAPAGRVCVGNWCRCRSMDGRRSLSATNSSLENSFDLVFGHLIVQLCLNYFSIVVAKRRGPPSPLRTRRERGTGGRGVLWLDAPIPFGRSHMAPEANYFEHPWHRQTVVCSMPERAPHHQSISYFDCVK